MAAAVGLPDVDAGSLRAAARRSKDGGQARRSSKIGRVTLQVVRDWALRFNAHGPDGLATTASGSKTAR
jgi:putative transposase